MLKIRRFICNPLEENAYVVSSGNECIIIDPGFTEYELEELYEYLDAERLVPSAALLTHAHRDHVLGLESILGRYGIPVMAAPSPDSPRDGQFPGLAGQFTMIATPGHTPDSVCYYNEKESVLFTGDTLFAGTIGRTDLPGGNYDSEIRSIMEKLIFLPGETDIYPGHGPASTIARERMSNPFLEPFNEKEELQFSQEFT